MRNQHEKLCCHCVSQVSAPEPPALKRPASSTDKIAKVPKIAKIARIARIAKHANMPPVVREPFEFCAGFQDLIPHAFDFAHVRTVQNIRSLFF